MPCRGECTSGNRLGEELRPQGSIKGSGIGSSAPHFGLPRFLSFPPFLGGRSEGWDVVPSLRLWKSITRIDSTGSSLGPKSGCSILTPLADRSINVAVRRSRFWNNKLTWFFVVNLSGLGCLGKRIFEISAGLRGISAKSVWQWK